jgi:hypothetical protein
MFDFDFLLRQMDDKIEKNSKKIQALAIKIIPLEEEKERIEKARQVLAGEVPVRLPRGTITSSIIEFITNNGPVVMNEISKSMAKSGIIESTTRTIIYSLLKDNKIKRNKNKEYYI